MSDQPAIPSTTPTPSSSPAPAAPLVLSPAGTPAPVPRSGIGRLTKIEIENYRSFRGRFELNLPGGCNLLVYGENGSGKSSLFNAIRDFLESPDQAIKHDTQRHRFNTDPASIRLSFVPMTSDPAEKPLVFEWSGSRNDPQTSEMRSLNKGKGFLDYKALLRVHLLRAGERQIDLFDLLIDPLFAHYKNPVSSMGLTFSEEWAVIAGAFKPYVRKPSQLDLWIQEFNAGFERVVEDSFRFASDILKTFDGELTVTTKFVGATYSWRPKKLSAPSVLARPSFRRLQSDDYPVFLNEARLSALALALYCACLGVSPAPGVRLLLLDDILIGLDMAHRVKVLSVIQEYFKDWQILILTYSKAWFERLKEQVESSHWAASWQSVVLWEEWYGEENSPRIVPEGSGNLLEMAARHLKHRDYSAAAVYARKALETLCHRTCAKASLFVPHVESPKQRKVEHFIVALRSRLAELSDDGRRAEALLMFARLDQVRTFVLNRNAHFDIEEEDTLSGEVGAAIQVLHEMAAFIATESWVKEHFRRGHVLSNSESLTAQIAAARDFVAKAAPNQGRPALVAAHNLFWEVFGANHLLLVPVGVNLSPAELWKAAEAQGKLTSDAQSRLNAARPYLFGTVKGKAFDVVKFEEAVKLIEELAALPVVIPSAATPTSTASSAAPASVMP